MRVSRRRWAGGLSDEKRRCVCHLIRIAPPLRSRAQRDKHVRRAPRVFDIGAQLARRFRLTGRRQSMFESNSRARRSTLGALLLVAATTMTACAHSQQAPPADSASPHGQGNWQGSRAHQGQGPRGDRMLEGLNLTKDQRDQIKVIRDRYRLRADSLRAGGAGRDSTSRSAFRSMIEQQMQEIRGVLTPDQQKQFDDRIARDARASPAERRARRQRSSQRTGRTTTTAGQPGR